MSATLRLLCVSAAALLLAACRPDPEDLIFIIGSVSDPASGSVLPGQQVLLERDKTDYCSFGAGRDVPSYSPPVPDFTPLAEAESDADGRFLVEVMRFQVARTDGMPFCLRLRLPDEEDGAKAEVQFVIGNSDMEPPPLFRWSPSLQASSVDGELRIPRPELPRPITEPIDWSQPQFDPNYALRTYEWELRSADGLPVWRQEATGELRLPLEALEDFEGVQASVQMFEATTINSGSFPLQSSNHYRGIQRSVPRPVPAQGVVAASRGARCWFGEEERTPCPLTDGQLELTTIQGAPLPDFPEQYTYLSEVQLELAAPAAPRLAVVRDLFYGGGPGSAVIIEGSLDGGTWVELGRAQQGLSGATVYPVYVELGGGGWYQVIPLESSDGPFNQFRLRSDMDGTLYGIRELSLLE